MTTAIIVAGGSGIRMKKDLRKQYLLLGGLPILNHTLDVFESCDRVTRIILVIPKEDFEFCKERIAPHLKKKKQLELVHGGEHRQNSVYNGLKALDKSENLVVIHDGVRPFVRVEQIEACIKEAGQSGACILGISSQDTVKRINENADITKTLDRKTIWLAQTPQVFKYDLILKAHESALENKMTGPDDSYLVEQLGHAVKIINGSKYNIKITTEEDLLIAETILQSQSA